MAETNAEFGRAVGEVLERLGATPETAGAALGINARTLQAMLQGIVPMRTLVIRFAEGIARRLPEDAGGPEWWRSVDGWLQAAGLPPRREGESPAGEPPPRGRHYNGYAPDARARQPDPPFRRPGSGPPEPVRGPAPPSGAGGPPPHDEPPAREYYRPVYERLAWGGSCVHLFWILDPQERRRFRIKVDAHDDYKARAAQVKQDLASLSRGQFERKYGRFRVEDEGR